MSRELSSGVRIRHDHGFADRRPGSLARHPDDGYRLADPYPLGKAPRRALRALIVALCPPNPAPASEDLLARVELGARRFMRYMHPAVARALRLALLVLDFLPLIMLRGFRRLHRLEPRNARRFVDALAGSRLRFMRGILVAVRSLVLSLYFDQTEVHEAIGYHPIAHQRRKIARRLQLVHESAASAEQSA